jgi:hypothetical protein
MGTRMPIVKHRLGRPHALAARERAQTVGAEAGGVQACEFAPQVANNRRKRVRQ